MRTTGFCGLHPEPRTNPGAPSTSAAETTAPEDRKIQKAADIAANLSIDFLQNASRWSTPDRREIVSMLIQTVFITANEMQQA